MVDSLTKAGIQINPDKSQLEPKTEVEFVGFVVSKGGVRVSDDAKARLAFTS